MEKLLIKSKNLIQIVVISLLASSFVAILWGAVKTISVIWNIIVSYGEDPLAAIALIELMDTFLIAIALFIFAIGLYELFIKDIELPEWLVIRNLYDLKAKLGSVIILVMSVTFLKHLVGWKDPQGTLFYAIAISLVSAALIAFSYFGKKD